MGHDLVKVYDALEERQQQGKKSEFETTEQWHQRVEELKVRPIIDAMKIQSTWAFSGGSAKSTYDADHQALHLYVDVSPFHGRAAALIARLDTKEGSSYTGSNAFGALRDVSRKEDTFHIISFTNSPSFGLVEHKEEDILGYQEEHIAFFASVQIAADKAKELKGNLVALVVCQLTEPYVEHEDTYTPATFESPTSETDHFRFVVAQAIEIWIFDQSSGAVYAKIRPRDWIDPLTQPGVSAPSTPERSANAPASSPRRVSSESSIRVCGFSLCG